MRKTCLLFATLLALGGVACVVGGSDPTDLKPQPLPPEDGKQGERGGENNSANPSSDAGAALTDDGGDDGDADAAESGDP